MPLTVAVENDLVILDLGERKCDLLLSCAQAEQLAEALISASEFAEQGEPSLVKGERWNIQVESFDGMVAMRITAPAVGYVSRVPVSSRAARSLSELLVEKASWAKHKMRLIVKHRGDT